MAYSKWNIANSAVSTVADLEQKLGVGRLAAKVLAARGYADAAGAEKLLNVPEIYEEPQALKDMDRAVARIRAALDDGERIAVFGDYDVDGITATALLAQYLLSCGADVLCSLPTRESSGYGLTNEEIDHLNRYGVTLIITVDNGISAAKEVRYAATLGIDVVICDHHLPPDELPPAAAVVDPLQPGDTSTAKDLAGVGVALKLAAAVEDCTVADMMEVYGTFAAIGTVADLMSLTGENRAIVTAGLRQMAVCENPGLAALCAACDLDPETIDARKVAFTIAPRLNAAGRMGDPRVALALLLCEDDEEAARLCAELDDKNTQRRAAEQDTARKLAGILKTDPQICKRPVLVCAAENLQTGVIGIVSSRLVERFGKPAILISVEGDEGRGSGRSVAGFSLHEAIASCAPLLIKYGGHDQAAGFSVERKNIEKLVAAINDYCLAQRYPLYTNRIGIDAELDFSEIDEKNVAALSALEPYGNGNEEPIFCSRGVTIQDILPMGECHSRLTLAQNGRTLCGAWFGRTPDTLPVRKGDLVDAAYSLSIYRTHNRSMVSVRFRDFHPNGDDAGYSASISAYEEFCVREDGGAVDVSLFAPEREDIAAVYRQLRVQAVDRGNYNDLALQFRGMNPGRAAAAIDILSELNLLERSGDDGFTVRAADNPARVELDKSPLFSRLKVEVAV